MELKKVYEAKEVLKEVIRETDVIYSPKLSKKGNVYLKYLAEILAAYLSSLRLSTHSRQIFSPSA